MFREIQAKTLLSAVKQPDPWFGLKYTMNLYRGCMHHCIYCDSRSECYQIENFDGEVLVKVNAIELLRQELARKRSKGTIGLGSMNDPFMPAEAEFNLAGRALAVIAEFGFPVHIITKSDLILKDLPTLRQIARTYAAVSFTITTADDDLARRVEPGAPPPSARFAALKTLAENGIHTGITLMPVLPFIEDNVANLTAIVEQAAQNGASYLLAWIGMSLRDRQRAYYYAQLERLFPGLRQRYERTYGERYSCDAPDAARLYRHLAAECERCGVALRMPHYQPLSAEQLNLRL